MKPPNRLDGVTYTVRHFIHGRDGKPMPIIDGEPIEEGGINHAHHEFDLMVTGVPGEPVRGRVRRPRKSGA